MKKLFITLMAFIILNPACMTKTVFYDVNPHYESHCFNTETIAVCPFNGLWKIEGSDTVYHRIPEFCFYAGAVAQQIAKKRQCLTVMYPDMVMQRVPEIESLMFKNRHFYKKTGVNDSSLFVYLKGVVGADYLLFFENLFSNDEQPSASDSIASMNTTILVFQLWDLKNRQFMYRGETKVSAEVSKGSGNGRGHGAGGQSVQNAACELVKSLPVCK